MTETTKWKQGFFADVEPIKLSDPLAYVLGAQNDGELFIFNYADAVLLAGHSCPAVSGAYKVTALALKSLYKNSVPIRGEIRVLIKGSPTELAYGPQSQVISFITGASGVTGFKGLGGSYGRNNKLFFDTQDFQYNQYIFQREDNLKAVKVTYNPQALPQDPRMSELAPKVLGHGASKDEKELFISLWQGNVKKILLEDKQHPGLFEVEELRDFKFPKNSASGQPF